MSVNPWIKFYPRDWRGDQALRAVSLEARGLWMECLCIMHEANPYGHLLLNQKPLTSDGLARLAGCSVDEVQALLDELLEAGVATQNKHGVMQSRRMIKDHARSKKGQKSVKRRYSQSTENKEKKKGPTTSPIRLPTTQKPEAREKNTKKRKIPIPEDCPNSRDQKLAMKYWSEHQTPADLLKEIDSFKAHHVKNGSTYIDWSAAWKTWYVNQAKWTKGKGQPTGQTTLPKQLDPDEQWAVRVEYWQKTGNWHSVMFGSEPPDHEFTRVPEYILKKYGINPLKQQEKQCG